MATLTLNTNQILEWNPNSSGWLDYTEFNLEYGDVIDAALQGCVQKDMIPPPSVPPPGESGGGDDLVQTRLICFMGRRREEWRY